MAAAGSPAARASSCRCGCCRACSGACSSTASRRRMVGARSSLRRSRQARGTRRLPGPPRGPAPAGVGGLRQGAVRRTQAGAGLPRPLHPSGRHRQQPAGGARGRRSGELPLEGLPARGGRRSPRSCACPPASSSAGSCSTCCPTGSTASATTACLPTATGRTCAALPRASRRAARRGRIDDQERRRGATTEVPVCPCCGGPIGSSSASMVCAHAPILHGSATAGDEHASLPERSFRSLPLRRPYPQRYGGQSTGSGCSSPKRQALEEGDGFDGHPAHGERLHRWPELTARASRSKWSSPPPATLAAASLASRAASRAFGRTPQPPHSFKRHSQTSSVDPCA